MVANVKKHLFDVIINLFGLSYLWQLYKVIRIISYTWFVIRTPEATKALGFISGTLKNLLRFGSDISEC